MCRGTYSVARARETPPITSGFAARLWRGRAGDLAAVAIVDQAQHDASESFDRLGAGRAIGGGDSLALVLGELALQRLALFSQGQAPLAAVDRPLRVGD